MNIVVYCGSGSGRDKAFLADTLELGRRIGEAGHSLVFGASDCGLMGAVSRAVSEHGGKTIGVVPNDIPFIAELCSTSLTRRVDAGSMADRKQKMIALGDAFVALPGGMGTLDEVTEIMELVKIGEKKPVVLLNTKGIYDHLKMLLDRMIAEEFIGAGEMDFVCFAGNAAEAMDFIEGRTAGK